MEKPKLYKKIKKGLQRKLSIKACREWKDNHKRNPLTNRLIKVDGRTYNKLKKDCDELRDRSLEMIGRDFIIEEAYGDGNCFFHSVLKLAYPHHLPINIDLPDDSPKSGHMLREILADSFKLKDYVKMLGGAYAAAELNIEYPYQGGDEHLDVYQLAKKQEPELRRKMKRKIKKNFQQFKAKFANYNVFADEGMIEYTARKFRLNIIIYNTEIPDQFVSARKIVKNRSSIFIYNWNLWHFDCLVGDNGKRVWKWRDVGTDIENL